MVIFHCYVSSPEGIVERYHRIPAISGPTSLTQMTGRTGTRPARASAALAGGLRGWREPPMIGKLTVGP